MANVEFGTGKSVLILTIVAACFAVLWPKLFYPMLVASPSNGKPTGDNLNGCCDVIFETDVNAIKIMTEMCGTILSRHEDLDPKLTQAFKQGKISKEIVSTCRTEVLDICGIDIAEFLSEKVRLGRTYRQILDEIRSFNISVCLRRHFGVNPGLFGAPRRMRTWGPTTSRHLKQERPLHLRPEIVHPALRDKGRAISVPPSHIVPKIIIEKDPKVRPPPIPGMRPPMGGAGHVVPAPKTGGTMSIVMPLYTIGIVIFFMYTIMKVFVRKTGGEEGYKEFQSDPEFRRVVFAEEQSNGYSNVAGDGVRKRKEPSPPPTVWKNPSDDSTRLGDIEIDHLRKRLEETERAMERIVAQMGQVPTKLGASIETLYKGEKSNLEELSTDQTKPATKKELSEPEKVDETDNLHKELFWEEKARSDIAHEPLAADESRPRVKVIGLETTAECEGGQRWSRPATPTLGVGGHSRSTTPLPPAHSPEPHNIFLEGSLPLQSHLLVTDSDTKALTLATDDDPEPPVILSGKMTLSLISFDPVPPTPSCAPECLDTDNENETFGDADSTLLDVDSAVIDNATPSSRGLIVKEGTTEERCQNANEDDATTNYTTATMSGRGEAEATAAEEEDTAADLSNIDPLDNAEDQEDLQDDNQIWNEKDAAEEENEEEEEVEEDEVQQQASSHQHQR